MSSTEMRGTVLVGILAGVVLAGAACGGSDGGRPPSPTPTPMVVLTGSHAELQGLLNRVQDRTFHVILERTAPPEIAGDKIEIFNARERTRVDTIPATEGTAVTSLIDDAAAGTVVSCEDGPTNWRCLTVESLGQSVLRTAIPFTFFPAWELDTFDVDKTAGRTIAGQEAVCFLISPLEEDVIEYCFTQSGVPVYSSPVFGTFMAVELSAAVSDEAFDPPARVD